MKTPISRRRRSSEAGFTLAELMIVVVLSGLSIIFVYYLFIQNARLYNMQEEIANMQAALNFSALRLDSDVQRAGFMTLLDNSDTRRCSAQNLGNAGIQAVRFSNGADKWNSSGGTLKVENDRIEMFGNYLTSSFYLAHVSSGSTLLEIDRANTELLNPNTFRRTFMPNQLISITGNNGRVQLAQIAGGIQYNNVVAKLTTEARIFLPLQPGHLNVGVTCGIGTGQFRIAPLLKVGYRLKTSTWQLIRETYKVNCNTSLTCSWTVMGNSDLFPPQVISENAVDLQFWFVQQGVLGLSGFDPTSAVPTQRAAITNDSSHNFPTANLNTLRAAFFRVSIRSDNEDATLQFRPRTALTQPLLNWDLNTSLPGAARVRSVTKQVPLFNFLVR
jgi:prepilin-type N-terminal cleavage/methylation domain-containing protein